MKKASKQMPLDAEKQVSIFEFQVLQAHG